MKFNQFISLLFFVQKKVLSTYDVNPMAVGIDVKKQTNDLSCQTA